VYETRGENPQSLNNKGLDMFDMNSFSIEQERNLINLDYFQIFFPKMSLVTVLGLIATRIKRAPRFLLRCRLQEIENVCERNFLIMLREIFMNELKFELL
jgi:hypothetical protein